MDGINMNPDLLYRYLQVMVKWKDTMFFMWQ